MEYSTTISALQNSSPNPEEKIDKPILYELKQEFMIQNKKIKDLEENITMLIRDNKSDLFDLHLKVIDLQNNIIIGKNELVILSDIKNFAIFNICFLLVVFWIIVFEDLNRPSYNSTK